MFTLVGWPTIKSQHDLDPEKKGWNMMGPSPCRLVRTNSKPGTCRSVGTSFKLNPSSYTLVKSIFGPEFDQR
jgi:hypothetical protein